jgi:hypothetical protein
VKEDRNRYRRSGRRGSTSVKMVVSPEMAAFREDQTRLNAFLWTTEISYGHILARTDADFPDRNAPARKSLKHATSNAWFPNNQGEFKFLRTTGEFLKQTEENTTRLYRLVLLSYYSGFEDYLNCRVGGHREGGRWGPFLISLSSPRLRSAPAATAPLPLHSVLCADFVRLVRNRMVHEPNLLLPVRVDDPVVKDWAKDLLEKGEDRFRKGKGWPVKKANIDRAIKSVVGHVAESLERASHGRKKHPPELFYLLFSFTELDRLACQIEEALLFKNEPAGSSVWRPMNKVRRPDLVIPAN